MLARTGPNDDAYPEEYQPGWSPDGRWISYINLENKERKNGLTLVQPNGKRRHRAVLGASEDDTYEWSPDGRWIANLNAADLYTIWPNGNWRKISGDVAGAFEWSPNGRSFAFSIFAGDLVVARGDGRVVKRLQLGNALGPVVCVVARFEPDRLRRKNRPRPGSDLGRRKRRARAASPHGTKARTISSAGNPGSLRSCRRPRRSRRPSACSEQTVWLPIRPSQRSQPDGPRVAFLPRATATDCIHVQVWTPGEDALRRLGNLADIFAGGGLGPRVMPFALAGSRAAWVTLGDESGDTCQFELSPPRSPIRWRGR